MEFIDNREILLREVEVSDIIVCKNARYMIIQSIDGDYGYVNLDSGLYSCGFKHISEIMQTFDMNTQFIPNNKFKLILE